MEPEKRHVQFSQFAGFDTAIRRVREMNPGTGLIFAIARARALPHRAAMPTVRDNAERHRFEIDLGDGSFAFADYTLPQGEIMFTHTEVPPAHEGKGLGTALIEAGLASARERGLKVIPICPFFAAYMKEHSEVQDLLDPAWRRKFGLD